MGLRVLYLGFYDGAEVFFFYFFTLSPGGVTVFVIADPDVAEVVFGVGNYDNDFAGFGVLVNAGRNVPEADSVIRFFLWHKIPLSPPFTKREIFLIMA